MEPDNKPPTEIDLDCQLPKGRNPVPRLIVVAVVIVVLAGGSLIYGLISRAYASKEQHKVTQDLAAEPATSSRAAIEAHDGSSPALKSVSAAYGASTNPAQAPTNPFNPIPTQPAAGVYPGQQPYPYAYPPPPSTYEPTNPAYSTPQSSPLEQLRDEQQRKELQAEIDARNAPTTVAPHPPTSPTVNTPGAEPDLSQLAGLLNLPAGNPLGSQRLPTSAEPKTSETDLSGKQTFQKDDGEGDYLKAVRTDPISKFEIQQGSKIPASLDQKAVSDIPGELTATVRRDVMDSLTGKYVLIPIGSKLIGEYNSQIGYAQGRLEVVWTRVIFPDTTYLDLGRMNAHAADGASGLKDITDNHLKRLIAGAVLSSVLSAGFQISQNRSGNSSVLAYPTTGQIAAASVGQQASQLGQELTQRNLRVQPTLKIRAGDEFFVFVKRDLIFQQPYQRRF